MEKNGTFNKTLSIDPYSRESPTECYKLRILGTFCTLLFVTSALFNSLLLNAFIQNKHLRTSFNILKITLIAINLIGTLLELPFVVT